MTEISLAGRLISVVIQRHARARRISLRLSPARDAVVMTLPRRASVAAGMDFFHQKSGWVLANVESDAGIAFADGSIIPLLGQEVTIRRMTGRGVAHLSGTQLIVYGDPAFTARRVRDFLKKHLQAICLDHARAMAHSIGKTVREVKIRDTSSRWGSCSTKGNLNFNWRLVFAPVEVLDYLIAHEVAHLAHMNHSPRFWQVVAALCPKHAVWRKWLKKEGHRLHRFD